MPIELDTVASRPFMRHGSPIDVCSRSAKIAASSALGSAPISIRYSSPPRWATRSSGRAKRFRRAATSRSTRSPVAWPSDSLTGLKPSRSMNRTARLLALAVRLLHRLGEHAVEHQPVRQAGQAVAEAAPLQLGLGAPQRPPQARLEHREQQADEQDRARADRGEQDQRRRGEPVGVDRAGLLGEAGGAEDELLARDQADAEDQRRGRLPAERRRLGAVAAAEERAERHHAAARGAGEGGDEAAAAAIRCPA